LQVQEWACHYGNSSPETLLSTFDLLIVDPDGPPPLDRYPGLVLAYLSVGEVNRSRSYFQGLPLLDPNPQWPDAVRIDLSTGAWQQWVLSEILPALKRYDGIFLDTVDTAFVTGQTDAMVRLIRSIRTALPDKLLLVNNPESFLEQIDVDGVVAESIFIHQNIPLDSNVAEPRAQQYRGRFVLSLEYATDPSLVRFALHQAREHHFVPYVTTPDLQRPTTHHREVK
jgi:uncharacterized protein (TIGR01370 family)